jgi:UDP-2,3-diacylglucosamine pyrophosphatase LpxH
MGTNGARAGRFADQLRQDHIRNAPFRVAIAHIPLYSTSDSLAHGGADARAKWHAHLADGGVDLLITGHTHRHAWIAPDATRPFGQLTGGGPRPQEATLIRAEADTHVLKARMHALDGTLISEHVIPRRT